MAPSDSEQQLLRLRLVEEHVALENRHDLDGIMTTFGGAARYDDEPWDAHYVGRDGVRAFYADLLRTMPDLQIDVQRRHASETTVVLEVIIRGRHLGSWRRPSVSSSFRSAASTRSTKRTDWQARRSTMTAPPCFASSASFMSRTTCGAASMLS
ncbi:MAG: nuclear transport factor 2 family protein [Pseudolabrys sp.]